MRKNFTKSVAYVSVFAMLVSGITFSNVSTKKNVSADESYQLVWSDEFDGDALNRDYWNVEVNGDGGGNNELQYYLDRKENINVSNGTLKITALKKPYGGKQYTSGRITTQGKYSFRYGKIEARIKLPSLSGIWPAFWMLGENIKTVGWPACGEMDIMEAINENNNVYANLHWQYNGNNADTSGRAKNVGDRTDWHIYGMEWDENTAKFMVDGKVYETYNITSDAQMEEFRKKQFIILNVAVGGKWPGYTIDDTKIPATMEVDYVRVYQKKAIPVNYDGPWIEVTEDSVDAYTGDWSSWFGGNNGWQGSKGTITPNGERISDGVTVNLSTVGTDVGNDSEWGAQAQLLNLHFYTGSKYTYKCTLLSNVNKRIFVKIADDAEDAIVGEWINLQANVPYNFSKDFNLDADFDGTISIKFGLGKNGGDTIADNSSATIKISDVSLITTTSIPDPEYLKSQETTTVSNSNTTNNNGQGTSGNETTGNNGQGTSNNNGAGSSEVSTTADRNNTTTAVATQTTSADDAANQAAAKVKKAKVKIKKVSRAKNGKKAKVTYKKVTGATGYEIRISTSKKFTKKATAKSTSSKTSKTIKKLKAGTKYYVKVRAFVKKADGTKSYSKWSKVKTVK
ncbi:MAG: glycoside hydrolase family 16 protein [Lachnospiraceae bacterium]|nr:glycoside hydrolase family 16 protein [Lachnospiraceae bacterium]